MKKLINFEDYLFNQIFESKKETSIVLSDRLHNLIKNIHHPIAKRLEDYESANFKGDKATLIDFDDKNFGNFTYTVPGKLIDYIEKEQPDSTDLLDNADYLRQIGRNIPDLWTKYRSPISIGKLIGKLFPGEYKPALEKDKEGNYTNEGRDIESFTNLVKVEREETTESMDRFKIVEGEDIVKYYNVNNYVSTSTNSTLGNSCMRSTNSGNYIEFYAKNEGVKMVIYMSKKEKDKILGRALLWDIDEIDGEKVDRKFMDRIYYVYETDMVLFQKFAKQNGWLHKISQTSSSNCSIMDTLTNKVDYLKLKTVDTFEENRYYPYLDTLKYYYNDDGYLTNRNDDGEDYYTIQNTNGSYEDNRNSDDENDDGQVYCELGDAWVDRDDAIWIESAGHYATQRYVNNNMVFSDLEEDYIEQDESLYSNYRGSWIFEYGAFEIHHSGDSDVETYEELTDDDMDIANDGSQHEFILYDVRGDVHYFDNDDKYNFESVKSLKTNEEIRVHSTWDKDKIFIYKGIKYYNDDPIKKDELIGQKRINFDEQG